MKVRVGDHVALKGMMLNGYTGTVVRKRLCSGMTVQFDPGQYRAGSSFVRGVRSFNIARKLPDDEL